MRDIKDSGERRQFNTGAVRDIQEGKGRCDLLPLTVVADMFDDLNFKNIIAVIGHFMHKHDIKFLITAVQLFCEWKNWSYSDAILDVSIHYEAGALKYGERNWEKGIPVHCYIDSGVRHLLKCARGDDDEPHDRAFIWNMFGAIWTTKYRPELFDIPEFKLNESGVDNEDK